MHVRRPLNPAMFVHSYCTILPFATNSLVFDKHFMIKSGACDFSAFYLLTHHAIILLNDSSCIINH